MKNQIVSIKFNFYLFNFSYIFFFGIDIQHMHFKLKIIMYNSNTSFMYDKLQYLELYNQIYFWYFSVLWYSKYMKKSVKKKLVEV